MRRPCRWAGPSCAEVEMQRKRVYIDDCLIGEAATWFEVHALMRAQGLLFINAPRGAEGPCGFYLTGTRVARSDRAPRKSAADHR